MSSWKQRPVSASGTTLFLSPSAWARVHQHAKVGYPHEVVGVLAGRREDGQITHAAPLDNQNTARPGDRYTVDGLELMRTERTLEAQDLEIVGYYHSHPDHPAMYSDTDRDLALPTMAYLITSVRRGVVTDTRCWRLRADRTEMDEDRLVFDEPTQD
ncbi:MAG: M67 family metallopeptidase [Oligoflexia bacterium]|nr:M67 family metallopeptidase [Oligoflexia bacterium]